MIELDLEPIKERLAKTTGFGSPSPSWSARGRARHGEYIVWSDVYDEAGKPKGGQQIFHAEFERDAEFCAHAHQDIPALLEEVERLRTENEQLRPMK